MKKQTGFKDKVYSNHNNAIIIVGGKFVDKESLCSDVSGDWIVMRDKNENIVREHVYTTAPEIKPNILIIDWVKDGIDFINATFWLKNKMGYDPNNIHLVWKKEADDDLHKNGTDAFVRESYERVDKLYKDIISGKISISEKMDGDIWIVGVDGDVMLKESGEPISKSMIGAV